VIGEMQKIFLLGRYAAYAIAAQLAKVGLAETPNLVVDMAAINSGWPLSAVNRT
jgi:hypothetical protein